MDQQSLEDAIRATQTVLQPLFAKPKLSSKLLMKPPFRFIHDIVTATLRSTGFPDGYFTPDELVSKNFADKADKIAWLDKVIRLVNACLSSPLNVRSSKIVSGLEPLETNILLTCFGRAAIDSSLDRRAIVARCLRDGLPATAAVSADAPQTTTDAEEQRHNEPRDASSPTEGLPVARSEEKEPASVPDITLEERIRQCNTDPERTRRVMAAIVPKPKCTDKLLGKPPFRFLHDLIMAVNKATDMGLEEIYSDEEMVSSNVKDKGAKLMFLDKIIMYIETKLGSTVEAKPGKIVSGLEPEFTCRFLQLLAVAATMSTCIDPVAKNGSSNAAKIEESTTSAPPLPPDAKGAGDALAEKADGNVEIANSEDARLLESFGIRKSEGHEPEIASKSRSIALLDERIRHCNTDAERTRQVMAEIVPRPKCTDKLLGKPPFRFLHDLIMAVNKATGMGLEEIYSEDEMVSSYVKDKEAKLTFLLKIIKHIEAKLDVTIEARPGKIVAGLEPELTCRFLQFLAVAATMDSSKVPNRAVDDSAANGKVQVQTSALADETLDQKEPAEANNSVAAAIPSKESSASIDEEATPPTSVANAKDGLEEVQVEASPKDPFVDRPIALPTNSSGTLIDAAAKEGAQEAAGESDAKRRMVVMRPTTARRRPPRVQGRRTASQPITLQQEAVPKVAGAILMDDEESLTKGNASPGIRLLCNIGKKGQYGVLSSSSSPFAPPDLQTLSADLQALTVAIAPLGRYMDHVPGDLEQMMKERDVWRSEHRRASSEIVTLEPLKIHRGQIEAVNDKIKAVNDKIKAVKVKISKNNAWISQRLDLIQY